MASPHSNWAIKFVHIDEGPVLCHGLLTLLWPTFLLQFTPCVLLLVLCINMKMSTKSSTPKADTRVAHYQSCFDAMGDWAKTIWRRKRRGEGGRHMGLFLQDENSGLFM